VGISTRSYNDFLSSALAIVATKAKAILDTRVGSLVRAVFEAATAQWLYLQTLILQVQAIQRGATSKGADLDSFLADFSFMRLPATYDTGPVTLTRLSPNASAPVAPVGAIVQSSLGNIQYQIVADASNGSYVAALNGYQLPTNQASISPTVQALAAGTASNVLAGAINQMVTNLPGFDLVTNASPINNAKDAESDAAALLRFASWFSSLSKATKAAISAAIMGVQQGLSFLLLENQTFSGTTQNGFFTTIVQDGSGGITSQALINIQNAIDLSRPFTVGFAAQAPTNTAINAAMTAVLPSTVSIGDAASAKTSAQNAVATYINGLAFGQTVPWLRCADVAIDAMITYLAALNYVTSGISVNVVTLNGTAADAVIAFNATARAGTIVVS
jgi:hypothetical protein